MKACAFGLTALLCSAAQQAGAFGWSPYQIYGVGGWTEAVAVGDVDGDDRDDVVVTTGSMGSDPETDFKVFVYFQSADGTLATPIKIDIGSFGAISVTLSDLDRNGIQDIIVGHNNGISLFKGKPGRTFIRTNIAGPSTYRVGTMDVDRDGHVDVVAPGLEVTTIYYGTGTGGIRQQSSVTTATGYDSDFKVGDLNSDGFEDWAITLQDRIYIYLHDAVSGILTTPSILQTDVSPWNIGGVAIGDFNDDGRNDVAIGKQSNSPTEISVYHQRAKDGFAAPVKLATYDLPGAILGEDIDGDGRDDLLVAHRSWHAIGVYLQGAAGLQAEVRTQSHPPDTSKGMAVGDINSDGCTDVVMGNLLWHYGNGCTNADLGVAIGLTPTAAAIRLEHLSGTAPLEQPLVQIHLTVRSGTLQTGTLPAGCVLQSQTANARRIECLVDTLAPGAVTTLIIPISAASSSLNLLTVSAQARTDTPERITSNNQASLTIRLAP